MWHNLCSTVVHSFSPLRHFFFPPLALLVHCGTGRHRWSGCIPMSVSACLSALLFIFFFPSASSHCKWLCTAHWAKGNKSLPRKNLCRVVDVSLIYKNGTIGTEQSHNTRTDIHLSHKQYIIWDLQINRFNNVLLMAVLIIIDVILMNIF